MSQHKSDTIGAIDDQVSLQKYGDQYLITYLNYNLNTEKAKGEFILDEKLIADKLYDFIMEGFESMNPDPMQFELKNDELRLY
jgi:anti-sigma28 factor (negative regulator of flagellin synthesis)|tara:strand:+ start:250 stop:498 length:249 start_codon:yes stop_codon:yes gene_type:complete